MRILITGATGFVGKHLVPALTSAGHDVFALIRSGSGYLGSASYVISDDHEAFRTSIHAFDPEVCLHLAAHLTPNDAYADLTLLIESNIQFSCRLFDAIKDCPSLKLLVNTGTFAEYFQGDHRLNPAYLYAASKTAVRSFLKYYASAYRFKSTTVVPYTIYGGNYPQEKIIDLIFKSVDALQPISLTAGEQILDFIHMRDVVDFYLLLIANYASVPDDATFHLGTGKGHNLKQLANLIEEFTEQRTHIAWGDRPYREKDTMYSVANIALQYRLWKWLPKISLRQGIAQYIKVHPYVA